MGTDVLYSASTMYVATAAEVSGTSTATADSGVCVHDSLRNIHMLDSIKVYLALTESQSAELQSLGDTLFAKLKAIRALVRDNQISRDSSHALVDQVRSEFIASVKLILTTDQSTLFDTWISLYWDKSKHEGGSGRPSGPGGMHGHHGGGH